MRNPNYLLLPSEASSMVTASVEGQNKGRKNGVILETQAQLTVHNVFPKTTVPLWLHPVTIWLYTVSG